ncbi:MAG: SDR family oxidoreductase [Gammaproteobacteria bacterium]|nr:SDR family oxidoreductase [Gammaproteobacteria bacterium]
MARFEGRVAMVTGAGSGIGRAMALSLAEQGAAVACTDIDEQGAQGTAARVEELGRKSIAIGLDVSDASAVGDAIARTAGDLGGLHVLMNNAGVGGRFPWDTTIEVNLSGVYNGLKHACPIIADNGGGAVVNTASVAGLGGLVRPSAYEDDPGQLEGISAYVAAKHGVVGLTKQFAVAFGKAGVRVNAVCPGYIVTPMTAPAREVEGGVDFLENLHPIGRLGRAEEVAAVASFLASDEASFVTGVAMPVDGGYTAR